MTLAYACVLIAAFLPYVWTVVAKQGGSGRFDNREPRLWLEQQDNPRVRRADAAQKNAFEAFPAFAAAVLMAQLAGVDAQRIGWLAAVFVVMRVLHGVFYVGNKSNLRSLVWFAGFVCVIALLVMAVLQVA
ncbi:MAPEG family protein [Luteimonas sp. e5]